VRRGAVRGLGDGGGEGKGDGIGEFTGVGGERNSGYRSTWLKYEDSGMLFSREGCSLDGVSEDSEVGDDGNDESSSSVVTGGRVIVSARARGAKRPRILGCVL
jgi:hypothetical protein